MVFVLSSAVTHLAPVHEIFRTLLKQYISIKGRTSRLGVDEAAECEQLPAPSQGIQRASSQYLSWFGVPG